jgi:hypothetical protein
MRIPAQLHAQPRPRRAGEIRRHDGANHSPCAPRGSSARAALPRAARSATEKWATLPFPPDPDAVARAALSRPVATVELALLSLISIAPCYDRPRPRSAAIRDPQLADGRPVGEQRSATAGKPALDAASARQHVGYSGRLTDTSRSGSLADYIVSRSSTDPAGAHHPKRMTQPAMVRLPSGARAGPRSHRAAVATSAHSRRARSQDVGATIAATRWGPGQSTDRWGNATWPSRCRSRRRGVPRRCLAV